MADDKVQDDHRNARWSFRRTSGPAAALSAICLQGKFRLTSRFNSRKITSFINLNIDPPRDVSSCNDMPSSGASILNEMMSGAKNNSSVRTKSCYEHMASDQSLHYICSC